MAINVCILDCLMAFIAERNEKSFQSLLSYQQSLWIQIPLVLDLITAGLHMAVFLGI